MLKRKDGHIMTKALEVGVKVKRRKGCQINKEEAG